MRKNFEPKTWLVPQPVMVISTFDKDNVPNAMVAAWGGIYDTNQIGFMLSHTHKTTSNLMLNNAFTLGIANASSIDRIDFLGMVSGNDVPDKVARAGFTVSKSDFVHAPIINELPFVLECKVSKCEKVGEDFYFVSDIVNISVDENILNDKGNICFKKLDPVIFDAVHSAYRRLGSKVANSFEVGEKYKNL